MVDNDDEDHFYGFSAQQNDDSENMSSSFRNPKNLSDFLNSPEFSQPINGRVDKTGGELYLMILKFCLTNNLPISTITNLFKLINSFFESPILPNSKYFFDKILNPQTDVEFHGVCPDCLSYLGEFGSGQLKDKCDLCEAEVDVQKSCNDNFFALINPSTQIKHLLETYGDHYNYVMNERTENDSIIEDVYDGNSYRTFRENLPEESKNKYVTMVFNTDGAPKFKSSNKSIWPIYLMVNEIPRQDRLNKIICCGLWFHQKKPDMCVYLQKFVDMFNRIEHITCLIKWQNVLIKPYIVSCCVDAPARAAVQGVMQFNGYYGCNWCLHPGVSDGAMRYPVLDPVPAERTHEDTLNVMLNFVNNPKNEMGIKYPSPFICLTGFNMIEGFLPDYMHFALEGIASQMLDYFVSNLTDHDIEIIDSRMEKIAVPKHLKRFSRGISERHLWKAREWENFVLYYSIPVLKTILKDDKYYHWLLFVEGLYIILQDKIDIGELNKAHRLFNSFLADMTRNYGPHAMKYNIHLLSHVCKSVFNWGPVWTNSTFCFESANRYILNAIKTATGAGHQVVRYINIME
uniref:Transposase domain-containing protein n=1 Tax=Trichogramma kaykai TaxID=54128 RepID=A0ABD2W9C4_9HYME